MIGNCGFSKVNLHFLFADSIMFFRKSHPSYTSQIWKNNNLIFEKLFLRYSGFNDYCHPILNLQNKSYFSFLFGLVRNESPRNITVDPNECFSK